MLTDVKLNQNVSFGHSFSGCKKLMSPDGFVIINGKLDSINCPKKTKIMIPKTVTEICSDAFRPCLKLQEVHIHDKVSKIGYMALGNTYSFPATICAPSGSYAEQYAKEHRIKFIAEK